MNNIDPNKLRTIVDKAISSFNELDSYLIKNDLSERCICARFALHLTKALENTSYNNYVVDVEYNRGACGKEDGIKKMDGNPITVDLIVHKRGYDINLGFINLICIEMKKSTNRQGCGNDETRLDKMCSYEYHFCYSVGYMILINMEKNCLEIKKAFEKH